MLPVVKGKSHTRFQILLYTLVLVPLGVLPAFAAWGSAECSIWPFQRRHRPAGSCVEAIGTYFGNAMKPRSPRPTACSACRCST